MARRDGARICLQALRQTLGREPRLSFAAKVNSAQYQSRYLTRSSFVQASESKDGNGAAASAAPKEVNGRGVFQGSGAKAPTAAVDRTRSKLPTAKAKAQASKALRQQLQAASGSSLRVVPASKPGLGKSVHAENNDEDRASATGRSLAARQAAHPQLKEVVAWATADSYDFDALIRSGNLPPGWKLLEDDEAIHVPSWPAHAYNNNLKVQDVFDNVAHAPPGTGEVFIFQSGSYVTWGLSEEQSQRFLRSVIRVRSNDTKRAMHREVEREKYVHVGDEAMEWIWRESEPTRIVGDVIVLGRAPSAPIASKGSEDAVDAQKDSAEQAAAAVANEDWSPLLARLAFSQGLSRSARLSAQETALDNFLFSLNSIPEQLEKFGKVPLPRKEVIRKMGTLLTLRQRANLSKDNFLDDPEGHWDNKPMEDLYDAICRSLDVEPRFRALNEKLNYGENLLDVIRALLTERSSHRMELIIIYLIAFEAALAVISHDYVPTPQRIYRLVTGKTWGEQQVESTPAIASSTGSPAEIGLTIGLLRRALSVLSHNEVETGPSIAHEQPATRLV